MTDHRARSRSPPPAREGPSRRRSRSPRRRDDREGDRHRDSRDRPRGTGGFKWKEKSNKDKNEELNGGGKGLERGYRNRSRSPRQERQPESNGVSIEDKFGVADKFGPSKTSDAKTEVENTDKPPQRAPAAAAETQVAHGEPMIIVHVNDRLGTKAAIPCLASDPIKLFKAQVAARIGRQPHEILLKRQGERPFKDQLTLEDYGVSNGVQIDLEIDTGE